MMRNGWQRIVARAVTAVAPLAVTLALGTAVLWATPLAHADPGGAGFVQQLSAAGINITDPPPLVGNTARTICALLRDSWTVGTAANTATRAAGAAVPAVPPLPLVPPSGWLRRRRSHPCGRHRC